MMRRAWTIALLCAALLPGVAAASSSSGRVQPVRRRLSLPAERFRVDRAVASKGSRSSPADGARRQADYGSQSDVSKNPARSAYLQLRRDLGETPFDWRVALSGGLEPGARGGPDGDIENRVSHSAPKLILLARDRCRPQCDRSPAPAPTSPP